jgi:hypothetical protein
MNRDEIIATEERMADWQEKARAGANQEAKENGLTGAEALEFVEKRWVEIYDGFRELGEGI